MKTDLILSVARLLPALLLLFLPVGYVADSNAAQLDNIEFEWATELSREIGWFEAATGKIVKDRIVRRFSLICSQGSCSLTVVSFPARNCAQRIELVKQPRDLLEATQAGADVDFFDTSNNLSGDLSVTQRGQDSVLVEFTSHEPHRSKNSILVTYRNRFGPGGSKVPVKVTGVESGIGTGNSLYVGGDEIVKFEYRQLPASTVCLMGVQSRDISPR